MPGKAKDVTFDVQLNDGRIAHCWQAQAQPYQDCVFSAGLVQDIDPDTIYLKLAGKYPEPTYFFLRPDEALALLCVLSGALWSQEVLESAGEI